MTTELKPCPFCRYPDLDFVETRSGVTLESVACSNCGALGPCSRHRQEAADKWNSAPRAEPRVEREPSDELTRLRAENEQLRELLAMTRDYVASELAGERAAFKGFETLSRVAEIERDLSAIDAAMGGEGEG